MERLITLSDIAQRAGVSKMTVSTALHGSGEKRIRVSQETALRIREIAQEMGYRPNQVARSLKRQRTNTIGFYTGTDRYASGGSFLNDIVIGLRDGCDVNRKDLLIHHWYRDASPQDTFNALVDGRIEGLVIWTDANDPVAQLLAKSSMPVVAVADPVMDTPSVICDDKGGGAMIAEHLFQRGHRTIAFRQPPMTRLSAQLRLAGINEAAARLGMTVIIVTEGVDFRVMQEEVSVLFADHAARPTAVACWNDTSARELVNYCQVNKIPVPDTLAITGYDGLEGAPRLTTVSASWITVAARAVELILTHTNKLDIPKLTTIPVELVAGNTT